MLLAVLLAAAPAAAAPFVAWEFTSVGSDQYGYFVDNSDSYSMGLQFSVSSPISVISLGFFDYSGLTQTHDVGIYSSSGSLLTSATVDSSDGLIGHFRYKSLTTPYALSAGNYVIAAVTGADYFTWQPVGYYTNSPVTFGTNRYLASSTLAYPGDGDGDPPDGTNPSYFGPNFQATPVPPTLVLLGSGLLGLLGLGYFRKRA
jgi:hypothetical protein